MLSFFRKKSTTDVIDGILPKMDSSRNANIESASVAREALDSSELVRQLGYTSLIDLKETIYGKIFDALNDYLCAAFMLIFIVILSDRHTENNT